MRLAQDDEMVHALAPDRSDQPFGKAILPRRDWCDRLVPDAHGANSAHDDGAVDSIPIPNDDTHVLGWRGSKWSIQVGGAAGRMKRS
jgi:hypothetical protein